MTRHRSPLLLVLSTCLLLVGLAASPSRAQIPDSLKPPPLNEAVPSPVDDASIDADVPFVRSPKEIVVRMLELADVTPEDVVYDLGSGDGRIPITAARQFGARGVGIELRPGLVQRARKRAERAGVEDRVEFRQGDLFESDFSDATVVTLYLLPDVNTKLRPLLFEQLEPGTRIVSHSFDMDGWEPDRVMEVDNKVLYLWTLPDTVPDSLMN